MTENDNDLTEKLGNIIKKLQTIYEYRNEKTSLDGEINEFFDYFRKLLKDCNITGDRYVKTYKFKKTHLLIYDVEGIYVKENGFFSEERLIIAANHVDIILFFKYINEISNVIDLEYKIANPQYKRAIDTLKGFIEMITPIQTAIKI